MRVTKCTNLSGTAKFGLNIIATSSYNRIPFEESLSMLRASLGDRDIHSFLFLGDPQIRELGGEVFQEPLLNAIPSLVKSLGNENQEIEIYSTFDYPTEEIDCIIKALKDICSFWKVSPLYFFKNNFNLFLKNISLFHKANVLGETTYIIRDEFKELDLRNFNLFKTVFKNAEVSLAPKRGEESNFEKKDSYESHEVTYKSGITERLSFYNLQGKQLSYRGLFCDLKNHLEIDLSGNIYSCSTGFENKEVLLTHGFSDKELNAVLRSNYPCPYRACIHNDNMSLTDS